MTTERCLFWEEKHTLIVSDLHLGKTGHFRREGIAIPPSVYKADLQRLISQIYFFKADRILIVGDLTHSKSNKELDLFCKWRKDFSLLHFELVKGNHDILGDSWYHDAGIVLHDEELISGDFCFRHERDPLHIEEPSTTSPYIFSGHVHPGIRIKGRGKQSLRFPCFYFTPLYCILPAFSRFTGTYRVERQKDEIVYAIVETELVRIG